MKVAMGGSRNFSRRGKRRHFAYVFQVADVAMQMDIHKTLYCSYTTKRMRHESMRSIPIYLIFKRSGMRVCQKDVLSVICYRFC